MGRPDTTLSSGSQGGTSSLADDTAGSLDPASYRPFIPGRWSHRRFAISVARTFTQTRGAGRVRSVRARWGQARALGDPLRAPAGAPLPAFLPAGDTGRLRGAVRPQRRAAPRGRLARACTPGCRPGRPAGVGAGAAFLTGPQVLLGGDPLRGAPRWTSVARMKVLSGSRAQSDSGLCSVSQLRLPAPSSRGSARLALLGARGCQVSPLPAAERPAPPASDRPGRGAVRPREPPGRGAPARGEAGAAPGGGAAHLAPGAPAPRPPLARGPAPSFRPAGPRRPPPAAWADDGSARKK